MVELYVLFNTDNTIYRVSTVEGTGHPVKLKDDVMDFSKLEGYELNYDGYLVFNETKYNKYQRAEQAKEEYAPSKPLNEAAIYYDIRERNKKVRVLK